MSWKKFFKTTDASPLTNAGHALQSTDLKFANWASRLPEVYIGHPNRIERYAQYENMDADSEINASLDILAEFCTQTNIENGTGFDIHFWDKATDSEIKNLRKELVSWWKINEFERRIFKMFRNVLKYGDQLFIRDPETNELFWIDMDDVIKVIVNEGDGKEPEQYVIRNVNPNFQNLTVTQVTHQDSMSGITSTGGNQAQGYMQPAAGASGAGGSRFEKALNEASIGAEHVVHVSLTEGMDKSWPFGNSILERIFKIFKQKELLEDAILIYRIQRAPERRIFKIDVGGMPSHMAMAFVERVKNEIHQKRLPSQTGGGTNMMDATYNPLSTNEDYFFPQTCLSLDTNIDLLDGRSVSLQTIIDEYKDGKENYVYSINQDTHEIEPGKITWANKTRLNTKVLKVTLDNNEEIIVTPDHRFIMRDGNEVEAQYLNTGDSLMPLYLKTAKTDKIQYAKKYLRYVDNSDGKTKWVHLMVCPKSTPGTVIHHIDFDSKNNNPSNLVEMNTQEHTDLHKAVGTYSLQKQWNNPVSRQKLLDGIHKLHANASPEFKEMLVTRGRKNGSYTWSRPESAKRAKSALIKTQQRVSEQRTIRYNKAIFSHVCDLYNDGYTSIVKITKKLKTDNKFQELIIECNPNLLREKNKLNISPTDKTMNNIVKVDGYSSWGEFRKHYDSPNWNHKVVSVEWLQDTIDTGDITVESESNSHIFALSAGIFVHNSDGRGSSVETLPGGQNLGEIDDLLYFNNKLLRGLRIPSSYLPTGPDDGTASYNDGRLGTALQQEKAFNDFCQRLQRYIAPTFDKEFKMFLTMRGFSIDNSLFDLRFNPPQNFASYRQVEVDSNRIGTYTSLKDDPFLSKRFLLKRYLGMTEEEMQENDELWKEENGEPTSLLGAGEAMRGGGFTPGGFEGDMDMAEPDNPDIDGEDGDPTDSEPPPAPPGGSPLDPAL